MERMRYTPSIKLCLVTRGTLLNGKRSKACVWTSFEINQITEDGYYYFGRDTYDRINPYIFQRDHLLENAKVYITKLQKLFESHFTNLDKYVRRKGLKGTISTNLQAFDCCEHRHVFATYYFQPTSLKTIWTAIVNHQTNYAYPRPPVVQQGFVNGTF
jgi:hypothetical protein